MINLSPRSSAVLLGKLRKVEMPVSSTHHRIYRGSFSKVEYTKIDGTLVAEEWLYCREYFQEESSGIRRMLFCHTAHRCKNIAKFIGEIEKKLNLNKKTIIGPTQRYNISWIKVSDWWTKSSMRRSLFTIFLRCGVRYSYKEENFEKALMSNIYTRHTEYAVRRFLSGATKYTGKKKGWYNQFYWGGGNKVNHKKLTNEQIDKLLIYPTINGEIYE
jgi:hypothetical protein